MIYYNDLKMAVMTGRFDKTKFKLPMTVILGDNGGMFSLLNSLKLHD